VLDPTSFTKSRQRLLPHQVGQGLFDEMVAAAHERGLLSDEHFTLDGTADRSRCPLQELQRKDGTPTSIMDDDPGNPSVDFHGEKSTYATHQCMTDPEALLFKKRPGGRKPDSASWGTADEESEST
jgi:hypothetical protein